MEQKEENEDFQLELAFRCAVLQSKTAKSGREKFFIHEIKNLENIIPDKIWKEEGEHNFEAAAEFFFVTKDGGNYSDGRRLRFGGTFCKQADSFSIGSPLTILDQITTTHFKTKTESNGCAFYKVDGQEHCFVPSNVNISAMDEFQIEEHLREDIIEHMTHLDPQPENRKIRDVVLCDDDNRVIATAKSINEIGYLKFKKDFKSINQQ